MIAWVPVLHWSVDFFWQLRLRLEALSREGGETECEPGSPERPGTVPETEQLRAWSKILGMMQ